MSERKNNIVAIEKMARPLVTPPQLLSLRTRLAAASDEAVALAHGVLFAVMTGLVEASDKKRKT